MRGKLLSMRGKQDHSRERNLRRAQTDAEIHLWRHMRNRLLGGYKFRRQHAIGKYVVDFVCEEAKLIVEIDGGQHLERAEEDRLRTGFLESLGYCVVRFWNDEALTKTDVVVGEILRVLEERPSP